VAQNGNFAMPGIDRESPLSSAAAELTSSDRKLKTDHVLCRRAPAAFRPVSAHQTLESDRRNECGTIMELCHRPIVAFRSRERTSSKHGKIRSAHRRPIVAWYTAILD
jgi:hypothetical protein